MIQRKLFLLSLGCAKNLVDSEVMSGAFKRAGFVLTDDPAEAEIIVVNTCGFIESARAEGIEALLDLAQYKKIGKCQVLAAVGCMTEKFGTEMADCMPEIDLFVGVDHYTEIPDLILAKLQENYRMPAFSGDSYLLRDLSTQDGSAYLKIAEGCDNRCAYCLIPYIRGPLVSRKMEDILVEAKALLEKGVKEVVLIAQDCGRYGLDLYGKRRLPELLDQIASLPFAMVRLLYVYPDLVDQELLAVMKKHDNICHYLDMPIQHCSATVLQAMHRRGDKESLLEKVREIRAALPDVVLRTTVMLGFPGETEADFEELLEFLAEAEFDWLGAFPYFQEEGTPAADMPNQVEADIKQMRVDAVMEQASYITERVLDRYLGRTLTVLASVPDENTPVGYSVGRSQYQAPDVDGVILFTGEDVQPGQLYEVSITDHDIYDLIGQVVE